jgi:hypothetical protein
MMRRIIMLGVVALMMAAMMLAMAMPAFAAPPQGFGSQGEACTKAEPHSPAIVEAGAGCGLAPPGQQVVKPPK